MDTNEKTLADVLGFNVEPLGDMWIWRRDGETSGAFKSEAEARDAAEFEATSDVMGANNVSSEQWDALSREQQIEMAEDTFGQDPSP